MEYKFTEKQGQYLAYIYHYIKMNDCSPREADMQKYFQVTAPTVHQMVVKLESLGFISKKTRTPRSIKLIIPAEVLPLLK